MAYVFNMTSRVVRKMTVSSQRKCILIIISRTLSSTCWWSEPVCLPENRIICGRLTTIIFCIDCCLNSSSKLQSVPPMCGASTRYAAIWRPVHNVPWQFTCEKVTRMFDAFRVRLHWRAVISLFACLLVRCSISSTTTCCLILDRS